LKKKNSKIILFLIVFNLLFLLNFLTLNGYAAVESFEPDHGLAPEIDGEIDSSAKEWENASKEVIKLKGTSPTDDGITTSIWVMQNDSDLFISIQFEILGHDSQEFVGIIISSGKSESNSSFTDAKIVQFNGLSVADQNFRYYDYYVIDGVFYLDQETNGDGAALLDENKIIYEFRIPVNVSEDDKDDKDVVLDFGEIYAFQIIYGEGSVNTNTNKKINIITIEIEYPPKEPTNIWILVHNILCIIIFMGLGAFFGFYIYKIMVIKKKYRKKVSG